MKSLSTSHDLNLFSKYLLYYTTKVERTQVHESIKINTEHMLLFTLFNYLIIKLLLKNILNV